MILNKIKKISLGDFFYFRLSIYYLTLKSSKTFAFNSSPLKSFATILPEASNKKVVGICSTLYCFAIGSAHSFKLETCIQVILSFTIASFHFANSLSKETPTIFNPLLCYSL